MTNQSGIKIANPEIRDERAAATGMERLQDVLARVWLLLVRMKSISMVHRLPCNSIGSALLSLIAGGILTVRKFGVLMIVREALELTPQIAQPMIHHEHLILRV